MPRFLRDSKYRHLAEGDLSHWEEKKLFDVQTTIPLLFCGAAKGEFGSDRCASMPGIKC